jgi:Tol biopolymer transport system component
MKTRTWFRRALIAVFSTCVLAGADGVLAPPRSAGVSCELGVSRAAIEDLIAAVDALEASGALTAGQANALRGHLESALRALDAGNLCAAQAQLEAFRRQAGNFVKAGALTEEDAAPLIEGAEEMLEGNSSRIVFQTSRDSGGTIFSPPEIYVMNPDGTGKTRLTTHLAADFLASWSPDGHTIAFVRGTGTAPFFLDIYVMNPDGSGQLNLTNHLADYHFDWSPDSAKIAFASNRDGNFRIYVMDLPNGSNQTPLTDGSAPDLGPVWSPRGDKIAFVSVRDGNREIYVMNPNGSSQTRLTNAAGNDDLPNWSPDGSKIVFASERDGAREVYVMNADGSAQTKLTAGNAELNPFPVWSPDGSKIAFTSGRTGKRHIFTMDPDGANQTDISNNTSVHDDVPQWSPDGRKIAFTSFRDGNFEVYVMNADGSGQTNLSTHSAADAIVYRTRVWRP